MEKVYSMTEWHEILREKVSVEKKIFSIYERHTDIIVKGKREVGFGHKVQLSGGKINLILSCEIVEGNPKDSKLYEGTLEGVKKEYGKTPESSVADGWYESRREHRVRERGRESKHSI
jgi:IS5 family transposase